MLIDTKKRKSRAHHTKLEKEKKKKTKFAKAKQNRGQVTLVLETKMGGMDEQKCGATQKLKQKTNKLEEEEKSDKNIYIKKTQNHGNMMDVAKQDTHQ